MATAEFNYIFIGDAHTFMPELIPYHGTRVEVLRQLGPDDADGEVGTMHRVRAQDGFEFDVFSDDELTEWED